MRERSLDTLLRILFIYLIAFYHLKLVIPEVAIASGYLLVDYFFIVSGYQSFNTKISSLFIKYLKLIYLNLLINLIALLIYINKNVSYEIEDLIINTIGFSWFMQSTKFNYVSWYIGVYFIINFLNIIDKSIFIFKNQFIFFLTFIYFLFNYSSRILEADSFDFTYGFLAFFRGIFLFKIGQICRNYKESFGHIKKIEMIKYILLYSSITCIFIIINLTTIGLGTYILYIILLVLLFNICKLFYIKLNDEFQEFISEISVFIFVTHPLSVSLIRIIDVNYIISTALFVILSFFIGMFFLYCNKGMIYLKKNYFTNSYLK